MKYMSNKKYKELQKQLETEKDEKKRLEILKKLLTTKPIGAIIKV